MAQESPTTPSAEFNLSQAAPALQNGNNVANQVAKS
jgi:hypothetical protein